jgi:threonine dehydrogenase-like Zn-dependent dehydrogenase
VAESLGVLEPGVPAFFDLPAPEPEPGGFRVRTVATGLSAGTELTFVKGTNPYHRRTFDRARRVFTDGPPTSAYPVRAMGYMEVGEVTDSARAGLEPGTLVAMAYGHRRAYTAGPGDFHHVLTAGADPVLGTLVAQLGPICVNGLLHATAQAGAGSGAGSAAGSAAALAGGVAGRRVLVTGAGVIGLLTALFAAEHGAAEVAVADPTPERLAVARALGLSTVEGPAWEHWPDGADLAFQCRGRSAALVSAVKALRPEGVVIDLAFYQEGAPDLRLGEEFHHNGLVLRCAQIGYVPLGWNRAALARATVELLDRHGPRLREHLVTDVLPLADAPGFLSELASRRRHALLAVFLP